MNLVYPLDWPASKPRTSPYNRYNHAYTKGSDRHRRPVTRAEAQTRIVCALEKFNHQGSGNVVRLDKCELSSALVLNQNGSVKASQKRAPDPGAVLRFYIDESKLPIAIDKFKDLPQNFAAIAACVDSLRQLWRADAGTFLAAASGLNALPAPGAISMNWRSVLAFEQTSEPTLEEVVLRHRKMSRHAHPDKGGTDASQANLNLALADAKRELNV